MVKFETIMQIRITNARKMIGFRQPSIKISKQMRKNITEEIIEVFSYINRGNQRHFIIIHVVTIISSTIFEKARKKGLHFLGLDFSFLRILTVK